MNKKNKGPLIIFVLSIIIGLCIMTYPIISSYYNEKEYKDIIDKYNSNFNDSDLRILEAEEYNKELEKVTIEDAFSSSTKVGGNKYNSLLNIDGSGLMGHIRIPKLGIDIPIYHGTDTDVLAKGAGHFEGSSLPVGGSSTHSVISAHRGLPGNKLFTDLDSLKVGDMFYIYVYDRILAYRVDDVKVTTPNDVKNLNIEEGKDYVTLVTCTPYAINTHRLLVRGTRVEYDQKVELSIKESNIISISDLIIYIGIFISLVIIVLVILSKNKKTNEKK